MAYPRVGQRWKKMALKLLYENINLFLRPVKFESLPDISTHAVTKLHEDMAIYAE